MLFLLLAGTLFWDLYWELVWSFLAVVGLAYGVYKKGTLGQLVCAAALLAPLSIKLSLPFADVYLPIEFISAATAVVVFLTIVNAAKGIWLRKFPLPLIWLISFLPGICFSDLLDASLKFSALNGIFVVGFYYGCIVLAERGIRFPYLPYIIALIPVTAVALYHFAQFEFNPITISGIFKPFFYSHTMYGAVMAFLAAIALGNFPHRSLWKWVFVVCVLLTLFSGSRAALWSLVFMFLLYALVQFPPIYRATLIALAIGIFLFLGGTAKVEEAFAYNSFESHDPQASLVEKSMSVTNVQTDASNSPPPGSGGTAHSELLLQLSENGVWTPLLFLLMWLRWWYFGFFRVAKQSPLLPFFLGLSTYFFHMQFNNFLNQPAFAILFWGTAAYFDYQLSHKDHELLR